MKRFSDWLYLIANAALLVGYAWYLIHFDPAVYEPTAFFGYFLGTATGAGWATFFMLWLRRFEHD